jgi:hypothetical protein
MPESKETAIECEGLKAEPSHRRRGGEVESTE